MKVNGSSWKFALIFLTGIIIAAQLLFIIHWRWQYWQSQHWKEELPSTWVSIEAPPSSLNQTYPLKGPTLAIVVGTSALKPIVQELICPRDQKTQHGCYVIVDGPALSGSGISRFLVMEPQVQSTLAEAELKFPLHQNFTRENARQWPVLSTAAPRMDYQKVLVAQPFITQTFTPSLMPGKVPSLSATGKNIRRILCLGLRASGVNNFYANLSTKYDVTVVEAEPALRYIAGKWFGYEQTEQHRIFVENPAFYVTARARLMANPNTVKVPKRFDAILIDVCHGLGSKTPGICPINEFEEEQVIADLGKNLADNGTIVMHFASQQPTNNSTNALGIQQQRRQMANHEHQILQLLKKYFTNCYFLSVGSGIGGDLILTCTRRSPITRANYILGLRKLPRELQQFQANQEPKFFLDLEGI